jgi:hypothetical protein
MHRNRKFGSRHDAKQCHRPCALQSLRVPLRPIIVDVVDAMLIHLLTRASFKTMHTRAKRHLVPSSLDPRDPDQAFSLEHPEQADAIYNAEVFDKVTMNRTPSSYATAEVGSFSQQSCLPKPASDLIHAEPCHGGSHNHQPWMLPLGPRSGVLPC